MCAGSGEMFEIGVLTPPLEAVNSFDGLVTNTRYNLTLQHCPMSFNPSSIVFKSAAGTGTLPLG